MNDDKPSEIFIISLISHRDQKPRVEIKLGELRTQMPADAAIQVARQIMEVAAGSYADAFIFNYMVEEVGLKPGQGAEIINRFRIYRDKLYQEFKGEQREREE